MNQPTAQTPSPTNHLTEQERVIHSLMVKGLSSREIATKLGVEQLSVNWFVQEVNRKLGVPTPDGLELDMSEPDDSDPGFSYDRPPRRYNPILFGTGLLITIIYAIPTLLLELFCVFSLIPNSSYTPSYYVNTIASMVIFSAPLLVGLETIVLGSRRAVRRVWTWPVACFFVCLDTPILLFALYVIYLVLTHQFHLNLD